MRKIFKYLITICLLLTMRFVVAQAPIWSVGTSKTVPYHRGDMGIFMPIRYGIAEYQEIAVHPLAFFVMPNISWKINWFPRKKVKKDWFYEKEIYFSSRHAFNCPTVLLNQVAQRSIFNLLNDTTEVPLIFAFTNEIMASKWLIPKSSCAPPDLLLTVKLGCKFAWRGGEDFQSIEYPMLYQQTEIYHNRFLWYFGADLDGHLTSELNFAVDLEFLSLGLVKDWAVEHKALIVYPFADNWTLCGGYQSSFGTYPNGYRFWGIPVIDLVYKFRPKKEQQKGLFDPNIKMY